MALTVTLTAPDAFVARAAAAFGKILNLGRNCTQAEFKQYMIDHLRQQVLIQEDQDRRVAAATAADTPITIT